jgi:hypothetical protein
LNKDGWTQFRERVTRVSEDELAAFLRDQAALLQPDTMGVEEFAVFLRGHADFLRSFRLKKPAIPSKATDRTPIRGVLAMSKDESDAYIRDHKIEYPVPTPESEAAAQWEAQLFEAIESGEIGRKKPGRKPTRRGYLEMARKCLDEANGNFARARETFVQQAMKVRRIKRESAESRWAEARRMLFP